MKVIERKRKQKYGLKRRKGNEQNARSLPGRLYQRGSGSEYIDEINGGLSTVRNGTASPGLVTQNNDFTYHVDDLDESEYAPETPVEEGRYKEEAEDTWENKDNYHRGFGLEGSQAYNVYELEFRNRNFEKRRRRNSYDD